jgi:hypothetical protein
VRTGSVLRALQVATALGFQSIRLAPVVGRNRIIGRSKLLLDHAEAVRHVGPLVAVFDDPEIIISAARPGLWNALKPKPPPDPSGRHQDSAIAQCRGRLGLRVGTSMPVWNGTTMEPFVIGSLWGNLSNDNQATLVSTGTSFHVEDNLQDAWGEVSAGVNFFNPSANTSVFAKLDVTFGDNIDGVGGKAGMRVSW